MDRWQVIFSAAGWAGWALAAYQYWRNELTKRPLVLMEADRVKDHSDAVAALIRVRNRSPHDIYIHSFEVMSPADCEAVLRDSSRYGGGQEMARGKAVALPVHLKAFASGEFPVFSFSPRIEGVSSETSMLICAVGIARSRDTTSSKRFIVRQSIQMVKSNEEH